MTPTPTPITCWDCYSATTDWVLESRATGGDKFGTSYSLVKVCANRRTCQNNLKQGTHAEGYGDLARCVLKLMNVIPRLQELQSQGLALFHEVSPSPEAITAWKKDVGKILNLGGYDPRELAGYVERLKKVSGD